MYGIVSIYNDLNANLCDFDTKVLDGKVLIIIIPIYSFSYKGIGLYLS